MGEEEMSLWHRRELNDEKRRTEFLSQLNTLKITEDEWRMYYGDARYLPIVKYALDNGVPFLQAQYEMVSTFLANNEKLPDNMPAWLIWAMRGKLD